MAHSTKISVVLPVRDGQERIEARVIEVLQAISGLTQEATEVVVVDDGSRDQTAEVLMRLADRLPQVRVARHSRPRGMEAAGQTGLERSRGELVFIQEADTPVRILDLQQLYAMSSDESIVAARAESRSQPISSPLVRRMRAWGASTEQRVSDACNSSSLQMIRRSHLQRLASPGNQHDRLESATMTLMSVEHATS
jgi:glycosyltransferase involved in cell wall biosynthesis